MATLRTTTSRLLSRTITTTTRRAITCSIHAPQSLSCQHARKVCLASTTRSPRNLSGTIPARHFSSHHSQQQREPSQAGTNPNQTPPSGSTPKLDAELDSTIPPSKIYTFEDIQKLSSQPSPKRILIDVREPSEILGTGRIPTSKNVPISSAADSFFLPPEEFEDRFGFDRPSADQEVVFYCKAGVRSKAAARLAGQAGFGGKVGEFPGSWVEWFERGGKVERVE